MSEKQPINFAAFYVSLFLIANILLLPIGIWLGSALFQPNLNVYGGIILFALGGGIGTLQPLIGIPVSICYLKKVSWAKAGILINSGLLMAFCTFILLFYRELLFLQIWIAVAVVIIPGIILVSGQHYGCEDSTIHSNTGKETTQCSDSSQPAV